jgi:hypothetical protein
LKGAVYTIIFGEEGLKSKELTLNGTISFSLWPMKSFALSISKHIILDIHSQIGGKRHGYWE